MAKKKKAVLKVVGKPVAAVAVKPAEQPLPIPDLAQRVDELEGDLGRLATLLGSLSGEPIRSLAKEIVEKRQGK